MKKYAVFAQNDEPANNAGSKAISDMLEIARRMGYEPMPLYRVSGNQARMSNVTGCLVGIHRFLKLVRPGDIVLIPFPLNRAAIGQLYTGLRKAGAISVTLIHDVDYLRGIPLRVEGLVTMEKTEVGLLSQSDYLICQNQRMIERLKHDGVSSSFYNLKAFDYLYEGESALKAGNGTVVIAGNLAPIKASYIYGLRPDGYRLSLYGSCVGDISAMRNTKYCGSFSPDSLISNLCGDYGLVWDGGSQDCCDGNYGNYLRLNSPHKLSLYVAAGLPIVIWREAALCEFVERKGIGFGISSLAELGLALNEHTPSDFAANIEKVRQLMINGCYLKKALNAVEKAVAMKASKHETYHDAPAF